MKSVQVYKTNKHYLIICAYKTSAWSYIVGKPVFLLPLDISIEDLSKTLLEGLNHSRILSEAEEEIIRKYSKQPLLKEIKAKSFNDLYKKSSSCNIYVDNHELTIEPNKYLSSNEGLMTVTESVIRLPFIETNYFEITKRIVDVLK